MYPCSTKTREVLGNLSPTPKRFLDLREISRGRSPREISRVEGNLEGGGDGFPNTSRVLVEYGHSPHHQFIYRDGSENPSLWAGKDWLTVLKAILPCCGWENEIYSKQIQMGFDWHTAIKSIVTIPQKWCPRNFSFEPKNNSPQTPWSPLKDVQK